MPPSSSTKSRANALAFTLVELLAVVAVIAVLAGLLLPALRTARLATLRARDLANLRQIGVALWSYAGEHNQQFPGPLPIGQQAVYTGSMGASNAFLGYYLAPYVGCPTPTNNYSNYVCPILINAGLRAVQPANITTQINYLVNYGTTNLPLDPGDPGRNGRYAPFGCLSPVVAPANTLALSAGVPLNRVWLLCDLDRQVTCPNVVASGWFPALPAKPVHGAFRNFLYADGHSDAQPASVQP